MCTYGCKRPCNRWPLHINFRQRTNKKDMSRSRLFPYTCAHINCAWTLIPKVLFCLGRTCFFAASADIMKGPLSSAHTCLLLTVWLLFGCWGVAVLSFSVPVFRCAGGRSVGTQPAGTGEWVQRPSHPARLHSAQYFLIKNDLLFSQRAQRTLTAW